MSQIQTIQTDVWSVAPQWDAIKAAPLAFEAEAGFAMQILTSNEYIMGVAMRNRASVVAAVTNVAAIGITLNPAKKLAYLVPRDGRICLDISYMGLMDMAIEAGGIRWGQCRIVHEADDFELVGIDREPLHKFKPFARDRGVIVGAYCVVKTPAGDFLTHAMPIEDIHATRDRSSAWKAWITKKKSCPWVTDETEMIRKTVVKQAFKYWPKGESSRVEKAIQYLNDEAGEGLLQIEEPRGGVIKATDGAMEAMDTETQQYLRELGAESDALYREHGAAAAFDRIEADQLDNEQKVALWTVLASDLRSALKAEGAARREAAQIIPG